MLLQIKDLRFVYRQGGNIEVVRGVDIEIGYGECVALIGESGCGKTTIGLSITKLIPEDTGFINGGKIIFEDRDLARLSSEELRKIRGKKISYVFQEPFSSLNPLFTIYEQIKEALPGREDMDERLEALLRSVGLDRLIGRKRVYPHELSGGMQQRVMIAMAIASNPSLLVLDEPTTALDVSTQAQILELIKRLKNNLGISMLFISHDLRVVFDIADKILLMYAGNIMEESSKGEFISNPSHPYSIGLMGSIPSFRHRKTLFKTIEGRLPSFTALPIGCKFYPRCIFKIPECQKKEPDLEKVSEGHFSRCIRLKELKDYGIIKNS